MIKRDGKIEKSNTSCDVKKLFVSNSLKSESFQRKMSHISDKIQKLAKSKNPDRKNIEISEIINIINSLSEQEILLSMSNNNEFIRSISARVFVDKNQESFLLDSLKKMLKDKNEYIRDSAVSALCYLNSPDTLDMLSNAANDSCDSIKLRALTGIADIASEHGNKQAKEILKRFLTNENNEIKEFVADELSLLFEIP